MTAGKCVGCGEARTASIHTAMRFAVLTTSYGLDQVSAEIMNLLREVHS